MSPSIDELEDLLTDDPVAAHTKLEALVAEGDSDAMYVLAMALYDGDGVKEDRPKCLELLGRAAAAGHLKATHDLGCFHYCGYGFPPEVQSLPRAAALLQKSASGGYPASMTFLGSMYEHGEGVPLSLSQARDLYRQAADLGDELGQENLARLGAA
jgi:TPR repeat protein